MRCHLYIMQKRAFRANQGLKKRNDAKDSFLKRERKKKSET